MRLRHQAERQRDIAELQIEVDQHGPPAALGERGAEVRRGHRLADAALGSEHADQRAGIRAHARAVLRLRVTALRMRELHVTTNLLGDVRPRVQNDQIVRASG